MARVSLIVLVAPGAAHLLGRITGLRQGLSAAGHDVELLVVAERQLASEGALDPDVRWLTAEKSGKAALAYRGIRDASGDLLVIVDLEKGHAPEDVLRVLDPLAGGAADVVVASHRGAGHGAAEAIPPGMGRFRWSGRHLLHALARPLVGITDPSSGLVAVTRESIAARRMQPSPLGSRFVLELLVGAVGRRLEVPITRGSSSRRVVFVPSDLRLIKRLADDRFGNYSRLLQFCVVGASGMVVDLTSYAFFQLVLSYTGLTKLRTPFLSRGPSLDLAVAAALAIAIALVWNFSLNRRLTFNDARRGSIVRQFLTYVLSNSLAIALSYTVRLYLPSRILFFQRHKLAAAVVGIVAATGISFSMSRWIVFSRRPPPDAKTGPGGRCQAAALAERV
jgi:dolichol-phosphate mannosyltransferase